MIISIIGDITGLVRVCHQNMTDLFYCWRREPDDPAMEVNMPSCFYKQVWMVNIDLSELVKEVGDERTRFYVSVLEHMLQPYQHPEFPGLLYDDEFKTCHVIVRHQEDAKHVAGAWNEAVEEYLKKKPKE